MKRFLLFLVVAIAVVSLGLTIYYFSTDNEVIRINNAYVTLNKNALLKTTDLLTIENQSEYTEIDYSGVGDPTILEYSENGGYYEAKKGGKTNITIKTTNRHYSSIVIEVTVNDGSEANPFAIYSEAELRKIGNDEQYTTDVCYKQYQDIVLTSEWEPIQNFNGVYDGGNFTIFGMTVTKNTTDNNAGFVGTLGVNNINGHERNGKTGVIKNLKLAEVNINGLYQNVGAFAGVNNGKIQVCTFVSGKVATTASGKAYLGGIAGKTENTPKLQPTIDRCMVDGTIVMNSADNVAGGLTGANIGGQISESAFRGYAEATEANKEYTFGGLTNLNKASSAFNADIYDSYAYIKNSTNSISTKNIAGIAYANQEKVVSAAVGEGSSNKNEITGCYFGGENITADTKGVVSTPAGSTVAAAYLTKDEFKLQDKYVSYTYLLNEEYQSVPWNFETVWVMGENYPEVLETSELGTVYVENLDVEKITGETVTSVSDLYTKLKADPDGSFVVALDEAGADAKNVNWEPIENFSGKIRFTGAAIKNLKINNPTTNKNVGMFKTIDKEAVIVGLKLDYVTITGKDASNAGVLCAINNGAMLQNISIKNVFVEIGGTDLDYADNKVSTFGTVCAVSNDYAGHAIKNVTVDNVNMEKNFGVAGGIVGNNKSTITNGPTNTTNPDPTEILVNNMSARLHLKAHRVGGVAGTNSGIIEKTTVTELTFNETIAENNKLFTNVKFIIVGGISGSNYGVISNVYVLNSNMTVPTGSDYTVNLGGIAGNNGAGTVVRAYVSNTNLKTTSNYVAVVGGVVGDNKGVINLCVVDEYTKIKSSTTFVALNNTTSNSANLTFICSMVGGVAGINRAGSAVSIKQCVVKGSVEGFYAGGLAGISYADIQKSSFGYVDGGTQFRAKAANLTGFYAGGLVSLAVSGTISNCYAICTITGATFTGTSADWSKVTLNSAANMVCSQEVSAKAGFAVFVINNSVITNCYTVVDFNGDGINFATTLTEVQRSAAERAKYNYGTLSKCAYQTYGNYNNGGKRLTQDQFHGGGNNYKDFIKVGFDTTSIWDIKTGGGAYPRFYKIATQLPQAPTAY